MSCLPALAGVCPYPTHPVRRDTIILTEPALIVAGADTHADTIHVAAISTTGTGIGDRQFPTTRAGYTAAIRFLTSLGRVERVGVEGTASYGAGFTRALTTAGIEVVEVTRAVRSTPPAQRQIRSPRRLQRRSDRAGRRRTGHPERRRHRRVAGSAHRASLSGQAPHRSDQPTQSDAGVCARCGA